MKNILVLIFILFSLYGFSQNNFILQGYKVYEGKINHHTRIRMNLRFQENSIDGTFWNFETGDTLQVWGQLQDKHIKLNAFAKNNTKAKEFDGEFLTPHHFQGLYSDNGFVVHFTLHEITDDDIKIEYFRHVSVREEKIIDNGKDMYINVYNFPQISGLINIKAQKRLNNIFNIADISLNEIKPESKAEYLERHSPGINKFNYTGEFCSINFINQKMVSYTTAEYLRASFSSSRSYWSNNFTIDIKTGKPVDLDKIFQGNYKSLFKEYVCKSEALKQVQADSIDSLVVADKLIEKIEKMHNTEGMIFYPDYITIISLEAGDLNKNAKGDVIVSIPRQDLKPYIHPKGYLAAWLKKQE